MLKRELIKAAAICVAVVAAALIIGKATGALGGSKPEDTGWSAPATAGERYTPGPAETETPTEPAGTPTQTQVVVQQPSYSYATLAVAGDVICHTGLNVEADKGGGTYDYTAIMAAAEPYLSDADCAVCSLETTFPNTTEYSGYPLFKSPEGLAKSLADVGIDFVSTATNHCLDGGEAGLVRTLDVLDEYGLSHAGTYRTAEERAENSGVSVIHIGGISAAVVSYSLGTNGASVSDLGCAVNLIYTDYLTAASNIDYESIGADMEAARALGCDVIIACMHWGVEYQTYATQDQLDLTDFLFAEGADVIIGSNPLVPQPMELRQIENADGTERTGFVCWCPGNFISAQELEGTNISVILRLKLEKNNLTGETDVAEVSYVPMYMADMRKFGAEDGDYRYRLWDIYAMLDKYDPEDPDGEVTQARYDALISALERIHELAGEEYDYRNQEQEA